MSGPDLKREARAEARARAAVGAYLAPLKLTDLATGAERTLRRSWWRSRLGYIDGHDLEWRFDDAKALDALKAARAGDVDAEHVLREIAVEVFKRCEPLPPTLARFASAIMRGEPAQARGASPKGKRRQTGRRNPMRNVHIVCAILVALEAGVKRTRARHSKPKATPRPESACSIVAAELGMEEATVEKIWAKHDFEAMPAS